MTDLNPLETLYEEEVGEGADSLPLPPELTTLYGRLQFAPHTGRPYLLGNLVSTIDGVVSLNAPGKGGGNEISGHNQHDRMVMGILRAVADVIVVGAGTLRAAPDHLWTAQFIYPPMAESYQVLRTTLGKAKPPMTVIVTESGEVDLSKRTFASGEVEAVLVTTANGAKRLKEQELPPSVQIVTVEGKGKIGGRTVLEAVRQFCAEGLVLVEGGPHLIGSLFADDCLDTLFLTLAPQIAGRSQAVKRPGLVEGQLFAPEQPLWGKLVGLKRGGSHLFLRYGFEVKG